MITTVIFDLDGLLADTEPLHCCAYQAALRAKGATLTEADYVEHWVRSGKGIADWVSQQGLNLDPEELRAQKSKRYLELLASSLRPMDGAVELLETLFGKKTLALASSSYRDAVDGVLQGFDSKVQAKRNIVSAIETVAKKLGNTRAVCRKCYIHPAVVNSYLDGSLVQVLGQRVKKEMAESLDELRPEEAAVMAILEQQLKIDPPRKAA